jgi:hypothetical protein
MRDAGIVLAYHGCDQLTGERVLSGEEHIRPSINAYDWLGAGAYFWEGSPARALHWAHFLRSQPRSSLGRITNPFVVGAIISTGHCLDLMEAGSLEVLAGAYRRYAGFVEAARIPLPINQPGFSGDADLVKRHLDCAVINFLHTHREALGAHPFDTVRCPFFEGEPLYPGARIAARTHLQWCVRDPKKSVVGYFRVSRDGN